MHTEKLNSEATGGLFDSSSKGSCNSHGAIPKSSPRTSGTDDKTDRSKDLTENICSICVDDIEDPKELACKHTFCKACIDQSEKIRGQTCPVCKQIFGVLIGDMPEGKMTHRVEKILSLPGFSKCGSIIITYYFPSGYQKEEHPNPGKWYTGTTRTAYLPNNAEGQEVLKLLKIAFDRRLTFTIGRSVTSGLTDMVTWNDIHHKTNMYGGPTGFGYPDPDYLKRVKEELAAKGVK
ncbi:E3 ubiquitin-protein ligase DTX3L-like [Ptychodera flava]|uniref:E3 ubiquitin-protein ligase DTX3L-like n=1 Tax=Ptychodera flava TaxID=63121 RepID=UPI003969FD8C